MSDESMRDVWKARAAGMAPDIPADAVERAAAALEGLEQVFRPLLKDLPHQTEPAFTLSLPVEPAR